MTFPITDKTITINGTSIHYCQNKDQGVAIIFLNGVSMTTECWYNQFQSPLLNESFRLLSVDWPGTGSSEWCKNAKDYQPAELAHFLCGFIKSQVHSDYILVATSYASTILGEIQDNLPGCKGIVINGSSIVGGSIELQQILQPNDKPPIILMETATPEQVGDYYQWACPHQPELSAQLASQYFQADPLFRVAIASFITQSAWTNQPHNLLQKDIPLLMIHGVNDPIVQRFPIDRLQQPKNRMELVEIEQSGHYAFAENPKAFNQTLLHFANQHMYQ